MCTNRYNFESLVKEQDTLKTDKLYPMDSQQDNNGTLGYWALVSIGIGGMVGGGIFAVLGLAVQLAHGGTPLAFLIAGLVALLTTAAYARLSVAFPSQGGTVEFLNQAYGIGLVSGSLNILLWLSYIVMLSLYAYAFGSYGAEFFPANSHELWKHLLMSGVILLMTLLNVLGSQAVGRAETWIVGIKITILTVFIISGAAGVEESRLTLDTWSPPLQLAAGGMLIFLAYEGFELIANAAGDTRNPRRTLPWAFYSAVLFVILLYVLIAAVAIGNLPLVQIADARDYALAEAARPFLGHAGFILIGIAALLSTASAINATLYGAARFSYVIAKEGELPELLEHKIWRRPIEGLLLSSATTLVIANLFDLSSISMMGSAGFLLIFAAVNGAAWKLNAKIGGRRWIAALGLLACLVALAALLWQVARTQPGHLWTLAVLIGFSVAVEAIYRDATGKLQLPFGFGRS